MLKRLRLPDQHRYAAVLALIAFLVLAIGLLLKPRQSKQVDPLAITRDEIENLQQLVRRNSLRNISSSFAAVAEEAAPHLVTLQSPPELRGVAVSGVGLIFAKTQNALPYPIVLGNSQPLPNRWIPGLPLVLSSFEAGIPPASVAMAPPPQGGWVVVVAASVTGPALFSPGIYNGEVRARCGSFIGRRVLTTVPLAQAHSGAGLFDLAGDLLGVVVPCDDGHAIIPVTEIRNAMSASNSETGELLSRFGARFLDDSSVAGGLQVSEVWDFWPADNAGLQPGDVIIAVDGTSGAAGDLRHQLLAENSAHEIRISRSNRSLTKKLEPMPVAGDVSRAAVVAENSSGVAIAHIAPGSSADKSGLRSQDQVLTINGRPATRRLVERTLQQFQTDKPVSVVVRRGARRLLVQVRQ